MCTSDVYKCQEIQQHLIHFLHVGSMAIFDGLFLQVLLVILVVTLGCANNIAKQIAAVPLERFSYLMGVFTGFTYVFVYWAIFAILIFLGELAEPGKQLGWIWFGGGRQFGVLFSVVIRVAQ